MVIFVSDDEEEKLLKAIEKGKNKKVKSILEKSNKNNIILNLNYKDIIGLYPLLEAIIECNIEIVKLLIDYANQHQIILKLNEKDNDGLYPLSEAIGINNIEIVKLLIDYANQHQIILEYNINTIISQDIRIILENYEKVKKATIKVIIFKLMVKYFINKFIYLFK